MGAPSQFLEQLDPWLEALLPPGMLLYGRYNGKDFQLRFDQLPAGGFAGYRAITRLELLALVRANKATPGVFYRVSGRLGGKLDVLVQAASVSQLSPYAVLFTADAAVQPVQYDISADTTTALAGGDGGVFPANEPAAAIQVGNLPAGYRLANRPFVEAFRQLVSQPYQTPGFNDSLRVANASSQTYEVGTTFGAGAKSITWSTSNSQNVQANSVSFRDVTANTILASGKVNNGSFSVTTQAFTVVKGISRVYLISAVDTQGSTFSDDVTFSGLFKSYFGYFASKTLTLAQILNLGNGQLQDGHARTVGGVTAGAGLYTVYAWEDNNGNDDVVQVLQDGVDSIRGAFGGVQRASGFNALGAAVTMAYIVSNATKAFTGSTLEFK